MPERYVAPFRVPVAEEPEEEQPVVELVEPSRWQPRLPRIQIKTALWALFGLAIYFAHKRGLLVLEREWFDMVGAWMGGGLFVVLVYNAILDATEYKRDDGTDDEDQ